MCAVFLGLMTVFVVNMALIVVFVRIRPGDAPEENPEERPQ